MVEPLLDERLGEVLARRDEELGSPPGQPVERRLRGRANAPVIDPAGRLVEDADERDLGTAPRHRRPGERSRDRVEDDGARRARCCAAE